ncbi:DUF4389 domain-containing protein [Stutzerimonas azotifigens]|uniref:DUF4389 domain-containing protein n=1 Tax=Stutzerimonas azotifigens TaxID=291995 RepID=A0ABR5Z4R5_9GAMM|nr:DUF4389 domain-containing protein [Stutzerimonas azotifigens]MBA1275148.1 DUF4389 domain-containing protein [Stutzerimonas azotifigens]
MNHSTRTTDRENLILRTVWMLLFFFVWQLAELLLLAVVVLQMLLRLINGAPHEGMLRFGDSLSQYVAQIGRFATFNTDRKPWPMSDWPTPRPADIEVVEVVTPPSGAQEGQP